MGVSPLGPGSSVDRYTIEALIGRGGMGEVYRAVDTRLRRKVALKVLRTDDARNPDGVARLFREARAAAALSHPNTVAIHDLGESDGLFYIVMELVNGQPLLAYVGDERVSLARRLKWLTEIARALATAHKAGVIHRDVKPSNVMVSEDDVAKVLDFGLAKPMPKAQDEPESFGFKTQAGRVLGTVRYMAPEQMIGSDADGRSDQYSLGMTAFELLAGAYPPGKPFELPPLLNTILRDFPSDGALAVARMLKRIPEDRFASMEDVVSAFEDIAANRPVRALGAGPKPARKPVVSEAPGAPGKPGPETVPESPATVAASPMGTTLTSAARPKDDELSADTVLAIEEALQPTVSPSELAFAKTMLPGQPAPVVPESKPASKPAESRPAESRPAASSTLQSADAGDRVKAVREATSKVPNEPAPASAPKPAPNVTTTLASGQGQATDLVVELRKASESQSTLAAKAADAATPKEAVEPAPRVASVAPPKPAKPRKSPLWLILTVLFLAAAAFAGNYFGARSRAKE